MDQVEAWLGARPVECLLDRFAVDARWCLVHATQMTPARCSALAASGAVAGLCPITEANLGDGIFDGQAYLEAGGALRDRVRLERAHRARRGAAQPRVQPAADAAGTQRAGRARRLVGATLYAAALDGGARALGRDGGALAPGALAATWSRSTAVIRCWRRSTRGSSSTARSSPPTTGWCATSGRPAAARCARAGTWRGT